MTKSDAAPTDRSWLGDLPDGWSAPRLRRCATIRNGCDHKHAEIDEGGYPVYGSGGLFARCSDFLHPGPSVLLGRKGTIDNPQLVTEAFWTVDTSFYTQIAPDIEPRFFYYVCKTIPFDYFEAGSALPSMTQTNLYSVRCPLPPLPAQRAVADYLDSETSRIDSLIDRKQRFIELLLEKRTALITHAVTKGLDPDVEMKDSGVGWIGSIPAHWHAVKGRLLGRLHGSETVDENELSEGGHGVAYAKVSDLGQAGGDMRLRSTKLRVPNRSVRRRALLLFPKRGAAVFTNKVVIVEDEILFDSNLMGWEPLNGVNIKYLAYVLLTRGLDDLADVSSVPQINNKHIYPAVFPRPPLAEQDAIVDAVEAQTSRIDNLLDKTHASIELLKEYRTALISAAVTGQIEIPAADSGEDIA